MDQKRTAPHSDIYERNRLRRGGRKLPLRATVAAIAGLIVVFSVLTELVPTTSLWLDTINTLSDTALESLSSEAALYRATVVGRTLEKVNAQISVPVTESGILLGINGALPVKRLRNGTARGLQEDIRPLLHDIGSLFPVLAFIAIGWVNDLGQHLVAEKYEARTCGVFDNEIDPDMIWYSYNAAGTALNSTIVDISKNWPMITRAWWVRSLHNEVGGMAWTGPYWSVSPGDGFVLAFTRQVPDPENPKGPCIAVLTQSYSTKYLSSYFSGLRHTTHGWSMLLDWNMDMIAATDGYPCANSTTKTPYKATASPNATVREIVAEWAEQSGASGKVELSFELKDLYVDTALITQPGNLTFWLVLVTPKNDFLGNVVQKQIDTKTAVVRIVIILLVVEFVVMIMAVGMAAFLGDRLVKPLFLVSAQMKKVADMELTNIGNIVDSNRIGV
eukprot:m51a1_g13636 hypothetical protein (446) ;mRNA; f:149-1688